MGFLPLEFEALDQELPVDFSETVDRGPATVTINKTGELSSVEYIHAGFYADGRFQSMLVKTGAQSFTGLRVGDVFAIWTLHATGKSVNATATGATLQKFSSMILGAGTFTANYQADVFLVRVTDQAAEVSVEIT